MQQFSPIFSPREKYQGSKKIPGSWTVLSNSWRTWASLWVVFRFNAVQMEILMEHLSIVFFTYNCIADASCFFLQRDPAEEALKSNNMNLDQAMSALLEKKTELDKRGMAITGHDYNSGLINKPMNCPRPPLLSKDPSADPRLPFMDKVNHFLFLKNLPRRILFYSRLIRAKY